MQEKLLDILKTWNNIITDFGENDFPRSKLKRSGSGK
jgi:hypothetical protein